MKARIRSRRAARGLVALLAVSAAVLATALPSSGVTRSSRLTQVAQSGLGDPSNDYSWSMAWFKGKLYVGTSRDQECVENATLDFYFPGHGFYTPNPGLGVTCPADKYDMDLRAQIWQYTPYTNTWKMVYQSPADIPNPREPGKFVARDIGYRGMVVYNNQLYIGANTADEYIPEIAAENPPRILRTRDGVNFTPVNGAPGPINDPSGTQTPMGFRAMNVYNGRLFVSVIAGLTGDGVVEEVTNPTGANATFKQISPSNIAVFDMQVFNNQLYVGTGDKTKGYGVYRTFARGANPRFIPVVTNGAGRGQGITSVVSMGVFKNKLYVGASGWYNTALPASELIRIAPTGKWDLVAGKARKTTQGQKNPISGLPDGFGNPFNAHFWRQSTNLGAYYVGTNDWSYAWQGTKIGNLLQSGFGFDLWGTCDGAHWWLETGNAFGYGMDNYGARTMVSTPLSGFFIGTANHVQGTSVIRDQNLRPCARQGTKHSTSATKATSGRNATNAMNATSGTANDTTGTPQPPDTLTSTAVQNGTKLTWNTVPGAVSYTVLRADYVTTDSVDVVKPPSIDGDVTIPDAPDPTAADSSPAISVPTDFTSIGTSATGAFTDTSATPGAQYLYEVVAVSSAGVQSLPSNVTGAPSS